MTKNLNFISFEGIDFSGKTTQIKLLKMQLENLDNKVKVIREPGGTPISERIRDILLDRECSEMTAVCEVLLYSAARHQLVIDSIIPELNAGNFVLADRYVDSTTAYQGYGRELSLNFIDELNKIASAELMPHLTFLLDLDLKTFKSRKQMQEKSADRLENSGNLFFDRIRKGYFKIAEANPNRVKIINANQPIEQINIEIREFVASKLDLKI